jgi:uncharacterized protein YndB with AHSA1/START domain
VTRFEDAIEIDAPADRVFELAADPRHLPRIDPSTRVRLLSGGWTEVGSRHHVTSRFGGADVDAVHEITRYEPPRVIEERVTTRGSVMTAQLEVRATAIDRCVLVVHGEIAWGGSFSEAVSRLLHPLTGPPMRRKALRRIKVAAEAPDPSTADAEAHLREEG